MNLFDNVLDRADKTEDLSDRQRDLLLGALTDDIGSVLDGHEVRSREQTASGEAEPHGAWLRSIEVEGFRGIGRAARLGLPPGPGLHVVCGRNGSGKSSFSEALELLLTDSCSRWADRQKSWQDCWQNLHHQGATRIAAELAIDGHSETIRVEGEWEPGAGPGTRTVDRVQGSETFLERQDLGWTTGLETWRPFLSYNELGSLLEGRRSDLHDTLASVLGLEPLADAFERLETYRKDLRKLPKKATDTLKFLRDRLADLEDERAQTCLRALPPSGRWQLDVVEDLLAGTGPQPEGVERLRHLSSLRPLSENDLEAVAADLQGSAAELEQARDDRDASLAARVADLLDQATAWFEEKAGASEDCPVCGTPEVLDAAWSQEARERALELRETARRIKEARRKVQAALGAARRLTESPLGLSSADEELLGSAVGDLRVAWAAFQDTPDSGRPGDWAEHVREAGPPVLEAAASLRQAAKELEAERADAWRPVAKLLADWLPDARRAQKARRDEKDLKATADWLSTVEEELRNERFEPIKEEARKIWELLRARSNVSLDDLRFVGKRTSRRLESPFRYLLIDDPVQAMDPVKVEGLARVLEKVAESHQVVVFTHDDRLNQAILRLGIQARIQEVHRRPGSLVEIRGNHGPSERLFEDAHALVRDEGLPAEVRDRVVPGLCRQALETTALQVVRERRLARGEPHRKVEGQLAESRTFIQTLALVLFDDSERGGEVYAEFDRRSKLFGPTAVQVVKACNKGSHGGGVNVGIPFVRAAQRLDAGLEKSS